MNETPVIKRKLIDSDNFLKINNFNTLAVNAKTIEQREGAWKVLAEMRELMDKFEFAYSEVEKRAAFTPSLSSSRVFPTEHGNCKETSCPLYI